MKDGKFIQLGLKKKGRIVKNEQYGLKAFFADIREFFAQPTVEVAEVLFLPFFTRLSQKKVAERMKYIGKLGYNNGWNQAIEAIESHCNGLIDKDEFGKKKKK